MDQGIFAAVRQVFGLADVVPCVEQRMRVSALCGAFEQKVLEGCQPARGHLRAESAPVGPAVDQGMRAQAMAVAHDQIVRQRRPAASGQGGRVRQVPALVKQGAGLDGGIGTCAHIVGQRDSRTRYGAHALVQARLPKSRSRQQHDAPRRLGARQKAREAGRRARAGEVGVSAAVCRLKPRPTRQRDLLPFCVGRPARRKEGDGIGGGRRRASHPINRQPGPRRADRRPPRRRGAGRPARLPGAGPGLAGRRSAVAGR